MEDEFVIDRQPIVSDCTVAPQKPIEAETKEEPTCPFEEMLPTTITVDEVRKAPSLHSYGGDTESEFELSDDECDFGEDFRSQALDSDEEFDKLVTISSKIIEKIHKTEYPEGQVSERKSKKETKKQGKIIHEYDDLPPLEKLSITCQSFLVEFGKVDKIVDCMVLIKSTSNEVLDFDSFVFDVDGKSFGQIYDIFGQVKSPGYVVRFNTAEEASMTPIGMKVYYAPDNADYSKTPFKGLNLAAANRETLININKTMDRQFEIEKKKNMIAGVDSDIEFSDDDAEKAFRTVHISTQPQRENRKRDRLGGAKVRFNDRPQQQQPNHLAPRPYSWDWHRTAPPRPYRRDFDGQPTPTPYSWDWHRTAPPRPYRRDFDGQPTPTPTPTNTTTPPQPAENSTNPYAEFGVTDSFSGRFGV